MTRGYLVLEDGTVMEGEPFGSAGDVFGEVVFSTGMGGYQESMTDPSVRGQILIMTFPTIGNCGMCDSLDQSNGVHIRGLVVREYCKEPSKMYGTETIDAFMKRHGIPGISGIDTRDLVIKIRQAGTLRGMIIHNDDVKGAVKKAGSTPAPSESNMVAEVSTKKIVRMNSGKDLTVGVIDCGSKSSLLKELSERFNIIVMPYDTPAQEIYDLKVNGVLISNGPGDPAHPDMKGTVIKTTKELSSRLPIMGTGFGDQIVGRALGAQTYKMKFGHRGCNQPVKYDGRVYITSQNHGFSVKADTLDGTDLIADQFNVNDGTVEGMRHRDLPIFTVQYHPESSPGPCDTRFLFDKFKKALEASK
jgi:carbamoyl-phosphate synthase small subunit